MRLFGAGEERRPRNTPRSRGTIVHVPAHRIPQVLHFHWGLLDPDAPLPREYIANMEKWRSLHPEWTLKVHRPFALEELAREYPLIPYDAYERAIQRSDSCRPMLLHKFGGVYSDLDVEPIRTLDSLFAAYPDASVILVVETTLSVRQSRRIAASNEIRNGRAERRRRIANYFMASVPEHPFWHEVLALLAERAHLPLGSDYDVLYTTGPDVISEAAHAVKDRYADVAVLSQRQAGRLIRHHHRGSWREDAKSSSRGSRYFKRERRK